MTLDLKSEGMELRDISKSTQDDVHPFDDLRITKPIANVLIEETFEGCRNALYYLHHFQYKHGNLYRAILGREVVYDREWEEKILILLDELLSKPEHRCFVVQFIGKRPIVLRGMFWRWNGWTLPYAKAKKRAIPCRIRIAVHEKMLFFIRRVNDRVDIEGDILTGWRQKRRGVLTMNWHTWQSRFSPLFKEVRLGGSIREQSVYCSKRSPWFEVPESRRWMLEESHGGKNTPGADRASSQLSSVSKADRDESAPSSEEPMPAVSALIRKGLVSKPWRILENFRGTSVEEWEARQPKKIIFGSWRDKPVS